MDIEVSSWGGGIVSTTLKAYRQTANPTSGPVVLDFSAMPALTYAGLPGISTNCDFKLTSNSGDSRSLKLSARTAWGVNFERTLSLGEGCELKVVDTLVNMAQHPVEVPIHGLNLGPMRMSVTNRQSSAGAVLGIDSQPAAEGQETAHWAEEERGWWIEPRAGR